VSLADSPSVGVAPQPESSEETIRELRAEVKELRKTVAHLLGVIEKQGAEIKRLKARKPKTSRTSSKPPSSDAPWAKPKPKKRSTGRKRGAQPGHKGAGRDLARPEDVDETRMVKPQQCKGCSARLTGDDPDPLRHQITDIPPVKPSILEIQLHALTCGECGESTRAELPADVHASNFGPNIAAQIALMTGEYRISRRNVQRWFADTCGVAISLGAISNIERRITDGLEGAHAEALASVAESPTKHLDETTWRESGSLAWLWAAVGEKATAFLIRDSRRAEVAKELIGEEPSGITVSDRYGGYSFIDLDKRQVCLAHLIRDFRAMAEGEKELRWIGEQLLALIDDVFRLWHLHKDGELDRADFKRWTRPLRAQALALLDTGARSRGYETPGKCRGILKTEPAMWTFVSVEGVEPTNNVAERAVRPVVIHRKTSLGSQSVRGSDFVARMQTASATLRQQGDSLFRFVSDVARAVLVAAPEPKLLG